MRAPADYCILSESDVWIEVSIADDGKHIRLDTHETIPYFDVAHARGLAKSLNDLADLIERDIA